MKAMVNWLLLAAVIALTGCADAELDQLERTLADIRQSPGGQPPIVSVVWPESQSLAYQHSQARSPFLPPESISEATVNPASGALAPDQLRPAEPLEQFQLHELQLVGTLRMGGRQLAMIASPDGNVTSVQEGSYIGTDHGRISHIGAQEIRVNERVFTQREGWQERQVSLTINEERTAAR